MRVASSLEAALGLDEDPRAGRADRAEVPLGQRREARGGIRRRHRFPPRALDPERLREGDGAPTRGEHAQEEVEALERSETGLEGTRRDEGLVSVERDARRGPRIGEE